MFSKRSVSALSSTERQWLRSQYLRSGQCARCFHASLRRGDGESSNDQGTPSNTSKKPSRAERSARISSEISMLQKGPPPTPSISASTGEMSGPGSATGAFHAPPSPPGKDAGFLETPDEMGGPRMGENVSAGREGPNAQGVGRPVGGARGEEVIGGAEANPGHHHEWVERSQRDGEEGVDEMGNGGSDAVSKGSPFKPQRPKRRALLHFGGKGAATIAGGNFEGVIRDRLRSVSIPHSPDTESRRRHWVDLNERLKRTVVDRLVKGRYDESDVFSGEQSKERPVLRDVARLTLLNGSYLSKDGERLLEKVRSLLPAAPAKPAANPVRPGLKK